MTPPIRNNLSLHDALPISTGGTKGTTVNHFAFGVPNIRHVVDHVQQAGYPIVTRAEVPATLAVSDGLCYMADQQTDVALDRKSTRLNSSHLGISYAVFCLK